MGDIACDRRHLVRRAVAEDIVLSEAVVNVRGHDPQSDYFVACRAQMRIFGGFTVR